MLACYSIELNARRDFFLTHQLEIEREKVNQVNQELEGIPEYTEVFMTAETAVAVELPPGLQVQTGL